MSCCFQRRWRYVLSNLFVNFGPVSISTFAWRNALDANVQAYGLFIYLSVHTALICFDLRTSPLKDSLSKLPNSTPPRSPSLAVPRRPLISWALFGRRRCRCQVPGGCCALLLSGWFSAGILLVVMTSYCWSDFLTPTAVDVTLTLLFVLKSSSWAAVGWVDEQLMWIRKSVAAELLCIFCLLRSLVIWRRTVRCSMTTLADISWRSVGLRHTGSSSNVLTDLLMHKLRPAEFQSCASDFRLTKIT